MIPSGLPNQQRFKKKQFLSCLGNKKIDFHGQAQTGTGKTLAFGIPLLHRIVPTKNGTQALIVAPTRELAVQIKESIIALARPLNIRVEAIYGGVSMEDQISALKRGCPIVVGTPGRLNDHIRRKTLVLGTVQTLVLDEADIMLDMGFKEEVDEILRFIPKEREIWLFSATVKSGIADIMRTHMHEPLSVRISRKTIAVPTTKQYFCVIPARSRMQALIRFIESAVDFYGFIFCQTKILTSDVAENLVKHGYTVGALHGDMSQAQRNLVIRKFKNKEIKILVATDVAARGIDVPNLTHVINYSIPEDHESYIHRIGRTGRAGKEGVAITLVTKSETRMIQFIERKFSIEISLLEVPSRDIILRARLEEVSRYLTSLENTPKKTENEVNELLSKFSSEELRTFLARLIHDKYLSSLDLDDVSFSASHKIVGTDAFQEIFINVGTDDGITRDDVIRYLTKTGCVNNEQIQKVRVIKRRTFVQLPGECTGPLMNALRNSYLGGRRARINLTTEDQQQNRHYRPRY